MSDYVFLMHTDPHDRSHRVGAFKREAHRQEVFARQAVVEAGGKVEIWKLPRTP